ncbi:MAG: hypothetical protein LUE92_05365 [Clostridiales bacterium]|nr:hypothetical protein [Clostridiales bacterium]
MKTETTEANLRELNQLVHDMDPVRLTTTEVIRTDEENPSCQFAGTGDDTVANWFGDQATDVSEEKIAMLNAALQKVKKEDSL